MNWMEWVLIGFGLIVAANVLFLATVAAVAWIKDSRRRRGR